LTWRYMPGYHFSWWRSYCHFCINMMHSFNLKIFLFPCYRTFIILTACLYIFVNMFFTHFWGVDL
jgi:hypothetical protein